MHANGSKLSSGKGRVSHFTYSDSQLTSDDENRSETMNSSLEVARERKLRQEAEAQSVRLAGLLEKAVTQFDPPRHNNDAQHQIINDLSAKANQIEQHLQNLQNRKNPSHLISPKKDDNRHIQATNEIEDRVMDLEQQLERIEEGANQIAGNNRLTPKRWSSQMSLDSAMRKVDSGRHNLTPDKENGRVAGLEIELETTQRMKEDLRNQLEQMLRYAKSLETELRTNKSDFDKLSSDSEQCQIDLSIERQKLAEATALLNQVKNNAHRINSYSKRLENKLLRSQNQIQKYEFDNEKNFRENGKMRAEFERRQSEKDLNIQKVFSDISRENSDLKYQLEDERSKLRSLRGIQAEMGNKFRREMAQLSDTKELLIREKNSFEKMNEESGNHLQEIEVMQEIINKQTMEIDQLKDDNKAVLRATGSEIDMLMDSFSSKHQIPQFTSGTVRGLENEPQYPPAHTKPPPVYPGHIPPHDVSALNIPQLISGNQELNLIPSGTNLNEQTAVISSSSEETELHPILRTGASSKFTPIPKLKAKRRQKAKIFLEKIKGECKPETADFTRETNQIGGNEVYYQGYDGYIHITPPPPDMQQLIDKVAFQVVSCTNENIEKQLKEGTNSIYDFLYPSNQYYEYYRIKKRQFKDSIKPIQKKDERVDSNKKLISFSIQSSIDNMQLEQKVYLGGNSSSSEDESQNQKSQTLSKKVGVKMELEGLLT
ncbi:hypothetical protein LOD99_15386 [Oopsacas minuta]|uniref:SURP motif domain-containing protein n=1 Tax=Oopsacas minuta TaxID=111878 RepID=A0AAV7KDZ7_9METZ|nr:hypothetical protein LOD99_15386 [Oopsacas minuta]